MSITDMLQQAWNSLLEFMTQFIIPDWGAVIGLLPILIFLGVVGPLLTIVPLVSLIYLARKPRVSTKVVEGPQLAAIGPGGDPIFPVGLPYCRRDNLVYASGETRCDRCREELMVVCPMCALGRIAELDTCTNCGLVLKVKPQAVVVRPTSGPRPGGAAVA